MATNQEYDFPELFISRVEALEEELDKGNIDVYDFYEEMITLKEYVIKNK
jgi:uncharacterized protein (UPF0335 family)